MSKLRKNSLLIAVVMVLSMVYTAKAQDGMNVMSPYTIYGFGHMEMLGTSVNKSMAGAGVAVKSPIYMNGLNPAALSVIPQQSFLFSFGGQGNNDYIKSENTSTSSNKFNLSEFAFQFPVARKLGFGIIMNPYSYVGYDIKIDGDDNDIITNIGPYSYGYQGNGGITQLKAGFGWEPITGLSIGAYAMFYHGTIERISAIAIDPIFQPYEEFRDAQIYYDYSFTRANVELGALYSLRLQDARSFNVGLTYQPKVTINQTVDTKIDSYSASAGDSVYYNSYDSRMVIPSRISLGLSYNTPKVILAADYIYQDFTSAYDLNSSNDNIALTKYQDLRLGISFTPNRYDIRKALNRWTYRAGVRYGNSYLAVNDNKIEDYSVTIGTGVPIQKNGISNLNVGLDIGQRGSIAKTDYKETYFKLSIGVNIFVANEWFVRHKFK